MSDRRRKSLGRDPFDDAKEATESSTVKKLIRGKSPLAPDAREVEVAIRLTPGALKHLDRIREQLAARGRKMTRDEIIRVAITLLAAEDIT
ncbi:MAG TPA: hypothetical protein VFX92_10020 [Candidatus Krumholzibacteria bacterium]|nr:hypothetical protein [Candidatus Krumholzibacteria bacterium]